MWKFVLVKTVLHPASNIYPIEISEMFVITARMCPSLELSGICGNDNFHSLVDLIWTLFGSPTVIEGVVIFVVSWGSLGFMPCPLEPVSTIPVLGLLYMIVIGVDTAELI